MKTTKITLGTAAVCCLFITGCIQAPEVTESSGEAHLRVQLGVTRVGALAKSSSIVLNKLVISMTSSENEKIDDTLTSTTSPSLSQVSTESQNFSMDFAIRPGTIWKVSAKTVDTRDSIIHMDSTTTPFMEAGETRTVSLNLSPRYTMFKVQFLNIPDSLSLSGAAGSKQVLHINRLALKIDGVIKVDSIRPSYFTPNVTAVLSYDYVTPGPHTIQLLAYGPMNSWNVSNPLFSGSGSVNIEPGVDTNTPITLNWVGPTTGTASFQVVIGRVGQATVNGTLSSTLP